MTVPRSSGSRKSRVPLSPFRDPTAASALRAASPPAPSVSVPSVSTPSAPIAPSPAWPSPFWISEETRQRACDRLDEPGLPLPYRQALGQLLHVYDLRRERGDA